MGRPKGSKNKVKTEVKPEPVVVADTPVVQKKRQTKQLVLPEVDVQPTVEYIKALTDLAIVAGRNFYLDKTQTWALGFMSKYDNLRLEVTEDEKMGADVFTIFSGDEVLDTKHVFKVDVEDVVRGVLGAR